jgi:TRAP-type C4-dicarboxylate transport system permease small subunit
MDRIFAGLTWFGFLLLAGMTLLTFTNVFCRYVLNFSIAWADEVTLILLIWFVFIALAIGVRMRRMATIDLLAICFPRMHRMHHVATRVVALLTLVFGAMLIDFGWELIKIGSYSTLASFDLPSYLEYVFIPVSGALVMYSALGQLFARGSALAEEDYLDRIFMPKADHHV